MSRPAGQHTERLRKELEHAQRWIARLAGEPRPEELETAGDNTPFSEELDATQMSEEAEMRVQFLAWLTEREARLRDALDRLARGCYGLCLRCGLAIPNERLAAVPEAHLCLRCQSLAELEERHGYANPDEWRDAARHYGERVLAE